VITFFTSTRTVAATVAPKARVVPSALPSTPPKWLLAYTLFAPATCVVYLLAPLLITLEAAQTLSVDSLTFIPSLLMSVNGFIQLLYGWLMDSAALKNANVIGMLFGTYYFQEFQKCSPVSMLKCLSMIQHNLFAVTRFVLLNILVLTRFLKRKATTIVRNKTLLLFVMPCTIPLVALRDAVAVWSTTTILLQFAFTSILNTPCCQMVGALRCGTFT
jgi:hypothetical protein